jgi:hypothetical protein
MARTLARLENTPQEHTWGVGQCAIREKIHSGCRTLGVGKQRERRGLLVVMMVMMMVVVTGPGSERRACKHHQKQRCCKQFLHESNPNIQRITGGSARPRYVSKK